MMWQWGVASKYSPPPLKFNCIGLLQIQLNLFPNSHTKYSINACEITKLPLIQKQTRTKNISFGLKASTLLKINNFQLFFEKDLLIITPVFYEKQCVYWGRRVYWWNFLITKNEILDVSVSFLNDHLEETLGPTK